MFNVMAGKETKSSPIKKMCHRAKVTGVGEGWNREEFWCYLWGHLFIDHFRKYIDSTAWYRKKSPFRCPNRCCPSHSLPPCTALVVDNRGSTLIPVDSDQPHWGLLYSVWTVWLLLSTPSLPQINGWLGQKNSLDPAPGHCLSAGSSSSSQLVYLPG